MSLNFFDLAGSGVEILEWLSVLSQSSRSARILTASTKHCDSEWLVTLAFKDATSGAVARREGGRGGGVEGRGSGRISP